MTLFSSSPQYWCQRSQYVSTCPHLRNLCSNNLNLSPFILSNSRAMCYAQPVAPQYSLVRFHPPPAVFLFSPPSLCSPPLMRTQALGVKEGHSATATDKGCMKLSFDQSCAVTTRPRVYIQYLSLGFPLSDLQKFCFKLWAVQWSRGLWSDIGNLRETVTETRVGKGFHNAEATTESIRTKI